MEQPLAALMRRAAMVRADSQQLVEQSADLRRMRQLERSLALAGMTGEQDETRLNAGPHASNDGSSPARAPAR
jgi:hypothetical protein